METIFKQMFAPQYVILLIIAVVAWFKMIPGAQNENLKALWPGVAVITGIITQVYYALIIGEPINLAIGVGVGLGLMAAGLYKVADKIGGS